MSDPCDPNDVPSLPANATHAVRESHTPLRAGTHAATAASPLPPCRLKAVPPSSAAGENRPHHRFSLLLAGLALLFLHHLAPSHVPPHRAHLAHLAVLGAPDAVDDTKGVAPRTVSLIDHARLRIDAALYELSLPSIAVALRQAADRGVHVRLFVESDNEKSPAERNCLSLLGSAVAIRGDNRPALMHNKFLVIDRQVVWTGSVNLSWTGCHLLYDEAILLFNREIAADYEEEFENLWNRLPDASSHRAIKIDGVLVGVAFKPGADRLRPFLEAVQHAHSRIEVAAFSLTHHAIVASLAQRAREGIPVDIVLDGRLARGPAGRRAVAALTRAGCILHFGAARPGPDLCTRFGLPFSQDVKIHHKLLVADGCNIVTGSANLSANGMEHNDENVLWLNHAGTLARTWENLLRRARKTCVDDETVTDCEEDPTLHTQAREESR